MSSSADFWADGQWNFFCDLCGKKEKSSKGKKTWDNFYVCQRHEEVRNPQDFLKGVKDDQTVPWSRPEPTDTFVQSCSGAGNSAWAGQAVAGCSVAGNANPAFQYPTQQTF